jgi:hypothetical protein
MIAIMGILQTLTRGSEISSRLRRGDPSRRSAQGSSQLYSGSLVARNGIRVHRPRSVSSCTNASKNPVALLERNRIVERQHE